jgi:hypothetical protein
MINKLTTLALLATLTTSASAGMYTSIVGFGTKEIKPNETFTLDVIGENPRVYTFTTEKEPKLHCVIIFTEDKYKSPVMQCIPLGK